MNDVTMSCHKHRLGKGGRRGTNDPLWEKSLKFTVKIRYTEKIFENYRENPGYSRK
jgi:hypothetical protein